MYEVEEIPDDEFCLICDAVMKELGRSIVLSKRTQKGEQEMRLYGGTEALAIFQNQAYQAKLHAPISQIARIAGKIEGGDTPQEAIRNLMNSIGALPDIEAAILQENAKSIPVVSVSKPRRV